MHKGEIYYQYIHPPIYSYAISQISSQIEQKTVFHSKPTIHCHDVISRDRLDAIFLPFARFPRASCLSTFTAKIHLYQGFCGSIQEYSYPFSIVLWLYFVLNVFCIAVCFRGGRNLRLFRYFRIELLGFPLSAVAPTLSSPPPFPWGEFGLSHRSSFLTP